MDPLGNAQAGCWADSGATRRRLIATPTSGSAWSNCLVASRNGSALDASQMPYSPYHRVPVGNRGATSTSRQNGANRYYCRSSAGGDAANQHLPNRFGYGYIMRPGKGIFPTAQQVADQNSIGAS